MITLALVGIGAGNPDHLTREAEAVLRAADVVLIPEKGRGKDDLAELRREIAREIGIPEDRLRAFTMPRRDPSIADYGARVAAWHDEIAAIWARQIDRAIPAGEGCVALMVWGDPSLYDSTLRIAGRLSAHRPIDVRVVPGITALQAMTAGHAIPLNRVGAPVVITTGRRLRAEGWPPGADTVAVMLDEGGAFSALDPAGLWIWWTAYAGMPQEIRLSGPLEQTGREIVRRRAEARAAHGWIMDTYLLRRDGPEPDEQPD